VKKVGLDVITFGFLNNVEYFIRLCLRFSRYMIINITNK